jgi:hypothetical protein
LSESRCFLPEIDENLDETDLNEYMPDGVFMWYTCTDNMDKPYVYNFVNH